MPRAVADGAGVLDVEQDLREVELALRLIAAARMGRLERRLEQIAEGAAAAGLRKGCQVRSAADERRLPAGAVYPRTIRSWNAGSRCMCRYVSSQRRVSAG